MEPLLSKDFYEHLDANVGAWAESYKTAEPYPSICLDNFLPPELLEKALGEFPSADSDVWHRFNNKREVKLGSTQDILIPTFTRQLLQELNSGAFLNFLERLTGINHLVADTKLAGGGIHQILPGGKLAIHADFNKHPENLLDRRLNLLIYLNKDWREEYGGHFEMWDAEMQGCRQRVLPVFNRCVVFSTTSNSYHGHPDPLNCPPGWSRKSIALYYYTNGRPEVEIAQTVHSTLFRARPGEDLELDLEAEQNVPSSEVTDSSELHAEPSAGQPVEQTIAPEPADVSAPEPRVKRVVRDVLPPIVYRGLVRSYYKARESIDSVIK